MTFKLLEIIENDQSIDITSIIAPQKFNVSVERITSKETRAPINGTLYSGLLAQKRTISLSIRPSDADDYLANTVLGLLRQGSLYINYQDPFIGWRMNVKVVPGNISFPAIYRGADVWYGQVDIILREV